MLCGLLPACDAAPPMTAPTTSTRRVSLLSWALLTLSIFGFVALWVTISMFNGSQNSWMVVLAALDAAWMLRLGGWRPGPLRMGLGLLTTAAITALANWGIIAAHLGVAFGRTPWDSALRLGAHHAWTLAQLANDASDIAWILLGLVVAAIASR